MMFIVYVLLPANKIIEGNMPKDSQYYEMYNFLQRLVVSPNLWKCRFYNAYAQKNVK